MIAWWIWLGRHVARRHAARRATVADPGDAATSLLIVFDLARWQVAIGRSGGARGVCSSTPPCWSLPAGSWPCPTRRRASSGRFACGARCAPAGQRSTAWWAAAGLAAGLACPSKYSSLFLAPGMVLWLAVSRRRPQTPCERRACWPPPRSRPRSSRLNIAWNAEHGWLTFAKQFGRVSPHAFATALSDRAHCSARSLLLNPLIAGCSPGLCRSSPSRGVD